MTEIHPDAQRRARLLEAVGHGYRRRLIAALADGNPQPVSGQLDVGSMRPQPTETHQEQAATELEIVHNHLPRLEDAGYVSWDRENGQITKGPNFAEVAALLESMANGNGDVGVTWF